MRASPRSRRKAIILSGGPASVTEAGAPRAPQTVFELGVPVLGICYGEQTMCAQLGGAVEAADHREFGRAFIEVSGRLRACSTGVWQKGAREQVWMSHGDRVDGAAAGLSRRRRVSEGAPFAAIADDTRRFYGVHVPSRGGAHAATARRSCAISPMRVAGCAGDWTHGGVPRRGESRACARRSGRGG